MEGGDFRKEQDFKGKDFAIPEGVRVSEKHFYELVILPRA